MKISAAVNIPETNSLTRRFSSTSRTFMAANALKRSDPSTKFLKFDGRTLRGLFRHEDEEARADTRRIMGSIGEYQISCGLNTF